jgi:hypothetical protein
MLCPKNIKGETFATGSKNIKARYCPRIFITNYNTGRTPARKDARP